MYTKELIKEKLIENQYFIDIATIKQFVKSWKIDPIYEDDNKEEYFDDTAVDKIIEGLKLKSKGESDRRIAFEIHKENQLNFDIAPIAIAPTIKPEIQREEDYNGAELKKISLDITNQTVSFLADSIALKITTDITEHIKDADFVNSAMNVGGIKRDNEMMAKQISKLIEDNQNLAKRIEELEGENSSYKQMFGNWYLKV